MKKKLTVLFSLVLSLTVLSCSNEELSEFENSEKEVTKSISKGVIVPLEIDIDTLPPMIAAMSSSSDNELSSNLRALKEFPFRLRSISNNRYMRVDGTGQEVRLDGDINDDASKFYVKVFASSTGIPYMLYSKKTNTPLSVGYWDNAPNTKIVYAKPNDPSTGIEMSVWDIFSATTAQDQNKSNGVVIESQFYRGDGGGGGPYGDPFNYVMNAVNASQLRYARYENKEDREFQIEPEGSFIIDKVEFDPNNIVITKEQVGKSTEEYINTSPNSVLYDFKFENQSVNSTFFIYKGGIKFNTTSTMNIVCPILSSNNDFILYPKLEESKLVSYNGIELYVKTMEYLHLVLIEPNQKFVCDITAYRYNIKVGYVATARSSNNSKVVVKIVGVWHGSLTGEQALITETITDLRTKSVTTNVIPINPSMVKNVYNEK